MGLEITYVKHKFIDSIRYNLSVPDFQVKNINVYEIIISSMHTMNRVVLHHGQDPLLVVAVVPVFTVNKIDVSVNIVLYIFAIALIIFGFWTMKRWRPTVELFKVIQLILGQAVVIKKSIKIQFTFIFVISAVITNNLCSVIMKMKYEVEEISFNKFEDLDKSGLIPYPTIPPEINYVLENLNSYNQHLKNLIKRMRRNIDLQECLDILMKTKKILCIALKHDAEILINQYRNIDGSCAIKIAEPPLAFMEFFYYFEDASPFAKKFANTLRRIFEFGYLHMPFLLNGTEIMSTENDFKLKNEDTLMSSQLLILLFIGNIFAASAFFLELIIFHLNRNTLLYIRICAYRLINHVMEKLRHL